METICPLLTLGGDPRVVSGTPDAAHRCAAGGSLAGIDRDHQIRFCLGGGYEICERYRTHLAEVGPLGPAWGPAAPDATFNSTRLIVEPAPRALIPVRPRRLGVAALVVLGLLVGGAALAWIGLGGLDPILGPSDPSPSPSAPATPSASPEPSDTAAPQASPTVPAGPTPTEAPPATAAPTPVTYIVQAGDTLNAIAARYGTTAQAIMDANGLTSENIQVGQILIIPVP